MILSFINIRRSPLFFNTSLGTLRTLMNGKSYLIPLLKLNKQILINISTVSSSVASNAKSLLLFSNHIVLATFGVRYDSRFV